METDSLQAELADKGRVWVISGGRSSDIDPARIDKDADQTAAKEYRISEFARYLLDPQPVEIKKRLVGGEVHYFQKPLQKVKVILSRLFSTKASRARDLLNSSADVFVSQHKFKTPELQDPELEAHLSKMETQLRSYDTFAKRLSQLNRSKISHVIGICEDIGANYSYLKLQGSADEKINYLLKHVSNDVGVVLSKANISEGLFELRGFDFKSYDPGNYFRLMTYRKKGCPLACVLDSSNRVEFQLSEIEALKHLHVLEQSLQVNPGFSNSFKRCIAGRARPVKLLFNKQLEIDYSKTKFPEVYRKVFETHGIKNNQRNLIKPILNYLQIGVSFSYLPPADAGDDKMFTHISVLHDFRALEPLKKNLPNVYSEMNKRTAVSEAGCYYLLDSIKGISNA